MYFARHITVSAEARPLDEDELAFRRTALRSAVLCIGWMKLISVVCFMTLYFLVYTHGKESNMSKLIQYMILAIIPLIILNGLFLFLGALEERAWALSVGIWLCLAIASYNTVLGVMGGLHFIRTGHLTMHFMLAVVFAILAISLFGVMCHDVILIYAYKKYLTSSAVT